MNRTINMEKLVQLCQIANKDPSEIHAINLVMKGMEIQKTIDEQKMMATHNTA